MRKISMAFLILLSLALAGAATPVTISTVNQTTKLGQTFNIDINLIPMGNSISGWQLQLSWDPVLIKVNGITEGNFLKVYGLPTLFNAGTIANGTTGWNYALILGNNSGVSNPGVLMTLNVTAVRITHNITLLPVGLKLSDPNGIALPYTVSAGKVVVAPKYDINMDGVTDISDLTILGQNFMQSNAAYDVNGDGIIDISDFVLTAAHFGQAW